MNEDSECKRLKIGNAPLLCKFNELKAAIFGTLLSERQKLRKSEIVKTLVSRYIRPNRFL